MSNILKSMFGKDKVIFENHVEVRKEKVDYIVDTYDDTMYIYYTTDRREPVGLLDAVELKRRIESDELNTYQFTKEAYAQCEEFFKKLNNSVVA